MNWMILMMNCALGNMANVVFVISLMFSVRMRIVMNIDFAFQASVQGGGKRGWPPVCRSLLWSSYAC
jgi:hypothetical protein